MGRKKRDPASRAVMKERAAFVRMNLGTAVGSSSQNKFADEIAMERETYRGIENQGNDPGQEKLAAAYARHSHVKKRKLVPEDIAKWVRGEPGDAPLGPNGAPVPFTPVATSAEIERMRNLNANAKDIRDKERLSASLNVTPLDRTLVKMQSRGVLWHPISKLAGMGQEFFLAGRVDDELRVAEIILDLVGSGIERLRQQVNNGPAPT